MDRARRQFVAVQPQDFQVLNQRLRGIQSQATRGQGAGGCVGLGGKLAFPSTVPFLIPRPADGSAVGGGCVACVTCSGFCLLIQFDSGPLGRAGSASTTSARVAKELGTDGDKFNFSFKRHFAELCHRLASCTSTNSRLLPAWHSHDSEEAQL